MFRERRRDGVAEAALFAYGSPEATRMRLARLLLASLALLSVGCPPNVQQEAGFRDTVLMPAHLERPVGDLVQFEVRPPVARGTQWILEAHGLARFAGGDPTRLEWTAENKPILMESIVAPWNQTEDPSRGRVGWLWFGVPEGMTQPLDRDLPVRPLPYRDVTPVTTSATFSIEKRSDAPISFARVGDRIVVKYQTPIDLGAPYEPQVGAMLIETAGKKVLYAEVKTNFGQQAKERIGYDVSLSYAAASVSGPVEVVVVEWIGHGEYHGAFDVHRLVVDAT
jgi:hypothetical protein